MSLAAPETPYLFPEILGYQIVEQLYFGSRTIVYRGIQNTQQRPVVIKVLRKEYPNFSELVQFRNQYTITKNLPIPGIIQSLSLEPLANGYMLVMEDWGGISLGGYLEQQKKLPWLEVFGIALQLTDILHELAHHRVVHKDIKPANILINPESKQIKLIDFSIATLLPKEIQESQSTSTLEGTLAYLAPEQTGRMNRAIDYRTDFYALGVTLYQLLTGTLPFNSPDPLELVHCHIAKIAVSVNNINSNVPYMASAIVSKLMAKNAEDLYQSAMGLKYDLEYCLTQWKETGEIQEFKLGERDLSDRFLIPEKLYGREKEVQTLLQAFDRVADGASELMLVAGFSGIGKTAVVNEVHKPITRQHGYFIRGKYDQFNRNIPLSAFVQALRDLMGQLLTESDTELESWKNRILAAVQSNGQVLIEVIPELEQIIGKQPEVPELSGSAAQNRFNLLFPKFIEVFSTREHPLVIFLDDLQWADSASLQLIKLLMNDNGYLLMLGAYRDNEVSPVHPFMLTVEELKKTGTTVNTITLSSLEFTDVNHLIADTLSCSRELAKPLTQLVIQKTKGNPFFLTQFLKALHEDRLIAFNYEQRYWECDIAQVKARSLTDDVVEFMAQQLQKLPSETQQVLKLAACIGNQFDLQTLAIVSEQSSTDAATALWKALQEGLILPISETYKFFQSRDVDTTRDDIVVPYKFLHDRVQQAAYSLIPETHRPTIHYRMGQLLLAQCSPSVKEERIFEIVGHLNAGNNLITAFDERIDLARLNLLAGRKAMSATAYNAALDYVNRGIELLPENAWTDYYPLTLELHNNRVEAAYLTTRFEEMETWGNLVLQHTTSILDQIKVYESRLMALRSQGQYQEVLATGLQILKLLGVEFPTDPTPADIGVAYGQSRQVWQGQTPQSLVDLPTMQDPQFLAAMQILTKLVPSSYMAAPSLLPLLIFKQIELCVQYGNCPVSIFSYAEYGLILCGVIGDIPTGYEFGKLSLALLEKLQDAPFRSRAYCLVHNFINHWKEPLQQSIQPLLEGYLSALENGDWECVALNILSYAYSCYWVGQNLKNLADEMMTYRQAIVQVKQEATLKLFNTYLQATLNLSGQAEVPYHLKGSIFNIDQTVPYLEANNDQAGLCHAYINQLFLCYLFDQNELALQYANALEKYQSGICGLFSMPLYHFYDAMTQIRHYSDASPEQQVSILQRISDRQEKLQSWVAHFPSNHQHRVHLIAAELARVLQHKETAIEDYDLAISTAQKNGFTQEEALANELAAKFYLNWGKEKIAAGYMQEAYYGYARWGAKAKTDDLEWRYPNLLRPILQQANQSLNSLETITSIYTSTATSHSSNTSVNTMLDFATILKASQTLSSEIQLDRLLATLLKMVLESAGADKAVLLMPQKQDWFVEAVAVVDQPIKVEAIAFSSSSDLPHSLVNTVKRNLQHVVITDMQNYHLFATDSYMKIQQPKSLLCTPIQHQGKLVAILYLENRVTTDAFTRDCIELLNILCTQAAISLENARLYQQAQIYAQQLEQSQLQIVQSEKMASLGNLVAGVAHEINNPIGFLNGSINNAKDYTKYLLKHLELYQQQYPNPTTPIQDNAEDIDLEYLCEDLPKILDSMQGATNRITNISTSLRTFSRADTEYKVSANLHEGIDSTILILKYRLKASEHRPAIEIIHQYGELPIIKCFPGQLNQVFMNILANGIDMFDEMAQTQSYEQLKTNPQKITICTQKNADNGNEILISIRDNGKGMDEATQARIFDHLFTTKAVGKGTGLGLAITRQIVVEKHGGRLEVKSQVGIGTEFCIYLPISG